MTGSVKVKVVATVVAVALFTRAMNRVGVSSALAQPSQNIPATQRATTQEQPNLEQVLQSIGATAQQHLIVERALDLASQHWQLWLTAHREELEKLLDDADRAVAAKDRESLNRVQQRHMAIIEGAPKTRDAWEMIQKLLTYEQQQMLKIMQERPPAGLSAQLHRAVGAVGNGSPGSRACAVCHMPRPEI